MMKNSLLFFANHSTGRLLFIILKPLYRVLEETKGCKKRICQISYYASGNAGDTVLSQCVRTLFKGNSWRLFDVNEIVTDQMIRSINSCDLLLIGGGGLFLPDTNKNAISGWQWAISGKDIDHIRVPLIVFSVGYNYFNGQIADQIFVDSIVKIVGKASFVGLRNSGSVRALRNLVPKELSSRIKFQPCTTTLIRKMYSLPPKKASKNIAINIAFDREERRYGVRKDEILSQVAEAVKRIELRGYTIYYVVHRKDDILFASYLKKSGVKFSVKDLSFHYPQYIYRFYNSMEMVIGMRGHAQMIPFGLNCEILSLGTHDKIKWFLEDIDSLDWYINLNDERVNLTDTIYDRFIQIHEMHSQETKKRLIEQQEKLWKITRENMKEIEKLY